jgi:hypothetical protein
MPATPTPARDPAILERWRVLAHRHGGYLIRIMVMIGDDVYVQRIDGWGIRLKGARHAYPIPRARVQDTFQTYVPCRWDLHCVKQRTQTIDHPDIDGPIDACDEHAAEYLKWAAANHDYPRQGPRPPTPDCWCPDGDFADRQAYCPEHGTPTGRGTNIDLSWDTR